MNQQWVEPDVREQVVSFVKLYKQKTSLPVNWFIGRLGISSSKYYSWIGREGQSNKHNGSIPRRHWTLQWEREAIIQYAKDHPDEGYRRLTYMMIDNDIAAVSPATTYRVLKQAGLLNKFNKVKKTTKGLGFDQPTAPHRHWHTDIKYVNYYGTFLFFISVIDGFSRYMVHHELRMSMQEFDVQITIQRALEKYSGCKPRIISDNGSQFISKDFAEYLKQLGLQHIRTSIAYPQSNGKIERYHRTLQQECLQKKSFINLDDARKQIAWFVDYYNTKRLHSSLYYLTPEDFLLNCIDEKLKLRERKLKEARLYRFSHRDSIEEVRNAN
jgi:transposase InsO family protein